MTRYFDIVIVIVGRLPGGSSGALAEEIAIQARAGHRTALLQLDTTLLSDRHPLAPRLRACLHRGELELALGSTPTRQTCCRSGARGSRRSSTPNTCPTSSPSTGC